MTPRPLLAKLRDIYDATHVHAIDQTTALEAIEEIERLQRALSDETHKREALERRLSAMFPLFQEARDALTAIPLAAAKLRGIDLNLADRMDDVGVSSRWAAREAEAPK